MIQDRGHLRDPSDVVFFPETFEALRMLQDHFQLFVVTNQGGIAGGVITWDEVGRVNRGMVAALSDKGIRIVDVYVCPHQRTDKCCCIKPRPYFLERAADRYGIDLRASYTVGDHPHDVELAKSVGACGIYVLTGHGQKHLGELAQDEDVEIATGIKDAADKIVARHLGRMCR
jgi:D-glycero-D-manno-heptose 1,7-bisphosphate phosphatase